MKFLIPFQLTEALVAKNSTILYRGDSSNILKFTWRRFDFKWAFFGPGLYLTDDPEIADSYTLKGAADKGSNVIGYVSLSNPQKNKTLLKHLTIANAIVPLLYPDSPTFQEPIYQSKGYFSKNYDDDVIDIRKVTYENAVNSIIYDMKPNGKTSKTVDQIVRAELKDGVTMNNKKLKAEFAVKYREFIQSVFDYFIPKFSEALHVYENEWLGNIRYIVQSSDDGVEDLAVIDTTKEGGNISTFEVDSQYLSKCLNGSNAIKGSKEFKQIMDIFSTNYTLSLNTVSHHERKAKHMYDWKHFVDVIKYQFRGYAIHDFLHHLVVSIATMPLPAGRMFWKGVIKDMKKLGYTGWCYEGGRNLGTKPHMAYCIWDLKKAVRINNMATGGASHL